jgi:hypothetical protein
MKRTLTIALLIFSILMTACDAKGKRGAAIALADSTAGLVAWSDATQVLADLGEIEPAAAVVSLQVNDNARKAVAQIAEKVKAGFSAKDVIGRIDEVIEELKKAEATGLLAIKNPDAKVKFREITAFAQLSLATTKNILKSLEPPPPPDPVKVEAALKTNRSAVRASSLEKWTQFILIGQNFAFAVIQHHRLEPGAAFDAEAALNKKLAEVNAQRLTALRSLL